MQRRHSGRCCSTPEKRPGVEIKIFLLEIGAKHAGGLVEHVEAQICLPMIERFRVDEDLDLLEKIRRGHQIDGAGGRLDLAQIRIEIERRRQRLDLRIRQAMVDVRRITARDDRHLRLGERSLHGENGVRIFLRLRRRFARKLQHVGDVHEELGADVLRFFVVVQVEVAVRQREPALVKAADDAADVVVIGRRSKAEEHAVGLRIAPGPCRGNRQVLLWRRDRRAAPSISFG